MIYNNLRKYYRIYVELNNISSYLYIAILYIAIKLE